MFIIRACVGEGVSRRGRGRGSWGILRLTEIGPLVGWRGLLEVQKQRDSQMETLHKQRGITKDSVKSNVGFDKKETNTSSQNKTSSAERKTGNAPII